VSDEQNNDTNESNESNGDGGFTAPYVSWGSFKNLLDRMEGEGLPMRIDRSYLSSMAGSTQNHLLKALRELDLIDSGGHPTEALKSLVASPESRTERLGQIVRQYYAEAISLGDNATQLMLEELFANNYNVSGSTRRKSIAFFLGAAKFGEIEVSKHFKTPKRVSSNGAVERKAKKQTADPLAPPPPPPSTSDDPKRAYVDLLLKKADEEMSPELLDRIERAIGLDPQPSESSPATPGGSPDS
jgi:hypothetical protein